MSLIGVRLEAEPIYGMARQRKGNKPNYCVVRFFT
jgi:hypothetical protein